MMVKSLKNIKKKIKTKKTYREGRGEERGKEMLVVEVETVNKLR